MLGAIIGDIVGSRFEFHNHNEGIKGAEATAVGIFMARCGFTKGEITRTGK